MCSSRTPILGSARDNIPLLTSFGVRGVASNYPSVDAPSRQGPLYLEARLPVPKFPHANPSI